ncbi:hypothetical protein D3C73_1019790 [compost metagenome]
MVSCQVVAEAADIISVGVFPGIVVRHDVVQEVGFGHMGIDHIENNAHSRFMDGIDHALQFFDPKLRVCRVLGISSIR